MIPISYLKIKKRIILIFSLCLYLLIFLFQYLMGSDILPFLNKNNNFLMKPLAWKSPNDKLKEYNLIQIA